jgi:regulator of protease activity HflC (stomatin/prohibitin superfamily)
MRHAHLAGFFLLLVLLLAGGLAGCTPHHTEATQVGIKFNKVTGSYEIKEAGATYFFPPIINDWKTYDVSLRNLEMTASASSGSRREKDDMRFKTRDGNDIETDVTVRWRIDPTKIAHLWKSVAPSTEEVESRLVRPLARAYIRDVLNEMRSEDFYNPTLRFAKANKATKSMADRLANQGVIVEGVLLGNFTFKPEYQKLINARKEAEKTAEKLEAEILATKEGNQLRLQSTVADLAEQLTQAQGGFEQAKKNADAYLVKRQQEAQAILAEKTAEATGIQRERASLNGSAGDAYVNLQLIAALKNKDIRQIPRLPSGNVIIDGNKLLQQLGVIQYQQNREEKPEKPEQPEKPEKP